MEPLSLYQIFYQGRLRHQRGEDASTGDAPRRRWCVPRAGWMQRLRACVWVCAVVAGGLALLLAAPRARAQDRDAGMAAIGWMEPRGINVVDLVGLVPEEHLRDTILRFHYGAGLVFYASGERIGDIVRVRLRYSASPTNLVLCPGKPATFDEWPSVVTASTMRVFSGDREITDQVEGVFGYFPAGLNLPFNNTNEAYRYPAVAAATEFDAQGAVRVPANMGCEFRLSQRFTDVTAEFVFSTPAYLNVTALGATRAVFRSYIGPGSAGYLDSLRSQMQARFRDRHDDIELTPPAGANYFLVKYPPTPVDPYVDPTQPGSGTYRVRRPNGQLSVDHFNSMALPLHGQWQDADQAPDATYLPAFSDGDRITAPEYFVPAGFGYDPCMTIGNCPPSLLDAIYDATMTFDIYYYQVVRVRDGLTPFRLYQVGPEWLPSPAAVVTRADRTVSRLSPVAAWWALAQTFLPLIVISAPPPDDTPRNCPCGWFDADGRMLDFVADS